MTINTSYYYFMEDGEQITIPIIIVNKQMMPNQRDDYPGENTPRRDWPRVDSKTGYKIEWLNKHDTNYWNVHDVMINIDGLPSSCFYIKLNWLQRIKMKIIWTNYWFLRQGRLEKAILWTVGSVLILGIIIPVVVYFIIKFLDKTN